MKYAQLSIAVIVLLASATPAVSQLFHIGDDPILEADYLAVKTTALLRPTASFSNEIQADLAAIRTAFPEVANFHPHQDWFPGAIWLQLTPQAYTDFTNGTFTGFDSLFNDLGTPEINLSFFNSSIRYMSLAFGEVYHSERLAELFREVDGVEYADAEWHAGDGNEIIVEPNRNYTIVHGFGDCPAGCLGSDVWQFAVTDEQVTMLREPGDDTSQSIVLPLVPEPTTAVQLTWLLAAWFNSRARRRRLLAKGAR